MRVKAIRSEKIHPGQGDIYSVLDRHLKRVRERSVVAVTSKIVAICEGRVVPIGRTNKQDLIKQEAEYYLSPAKSQYGMTITIKNNLLVPMAGIDESNGDGDYILWPKDLQASANAIRSYLVKQFALREIGVIITDSKTTPLRWGTSGVGIAYSGFSALNDYIGKPDIFGRKLKFTKANVLDALAVSAVLVMGEGNEQTPLALIEDLPFVTFLPRNPTKKELDDLVIAPADDLYAPLLTSVQWLKGRAGKLG